MLQHEDAIQMRFRCDFGAIFKNHKKRTAFIFKKQF